MTDDQIQKCRERAEAAKYASSTEARNYCADVPALCDALEAEHAKSKRLREGLDKARAVITCEQMRAMALMYANHGSKWTGPTFTQDDYRAATEGK